MTNIEWTDETWNPIVGCSVISPGCTNCYAMKTAARVERMDRTLERYHGLTQPSKAGPVWTGKIGVAGDKAFLAPLRWKRPRKVFVNSMSDLFHESVPDEVIDRVFAVMALCPQHTFQVLTKRSARMRKYCTHPERLRFIWSESQRMDVGGRALVRQLTANPVWPLPNVWLGVSVEDQTRADERIPYLLATPAAVRFISAEPLLGPVDLTQFTPAHSLSWAASTHKGTDGIERDDLFGRPVEGLDWVIVGGESGHGARPMHRAWAQSLRDQCAAADVPFFFKQWGEWIDADQWLDQLIFPVWVDGKPWRPARPLNLEDAATLARLCNRAAPIRTTSGAILLKVGKHAAGCLLDGREWMAYPKATP